MPDDRPNSPSAKSVGSFEVFALSFGTVVGIAWVFLLAPWLKSAGPLGTAAAIGVGALSLLPILLCYVRLVRRFPGSGGEIRYALETHGGIGGFLAAWLLFMAYTAVASFCLPALQGLIEAILKGAQVALAPDGLARVAMATTLASFVVVVVANYRGIETAAWLQDVTVVLLIGFTLALGVTAAMVGRTENLAPSFGSDGGTWPGFASVLATAPFLFSGFNTALQALGDVKPGSGGRRITFALVASIVAAAIFYAGVVVAITATLPRDRLLGLTLPALEGVGLRLGSDAAVVGMGLLAVLALVTSWNAIVFAASRVSELLAETGSLPLVAPGARRGALGVGIVTVGSLLLSFTGRLAVGTIVTFVSACMTTVFLVVCSGLWRVERREGSVPVWPALGTISAALLAALALRELPHAVHESPLGAAVIGVWALVGMAMGLRQGRRPEAELTFRKALGIEARSS